MKIGFIGLGKLGLPVSLAMHEKGYEVIGYDVNASLRREIREGTTNLYEPKIGEQLKTAVNSSTYHVADKMSLLSNCNIIFFAVQTPSLPDNSFDTTFLEDAVEEMHSLADAGTMFVIISTVLPGTIRERIMPLVRHRHLCYNASFIAMGTTRADFLSPEFILIGTPSKPAAQRLIDFYYFLPQDIPRLQMSWEEAETVKMAYNTMIGFKIVYANTLMELCDKIGHANVDTVLNAVAKGHRRITGPRYLKGGMGDGGACHPRDNLALSWLANKHKLSADPFRAVMEARKQQADWIGLKMLEHKGPYYILGKRYKPGTNLTDYSASQLVFDKLDRNGRQPEYYDPVLKLTPKLERGTYLVAIDDDFVHKLQFPEGSTIIDPWRCLNPTPAGCEYVAVGIS